MGVTETKTLSLHPFGRSTVGMRMQIGMTGILANDISNDQNGNRTRWDGSREPMMIENLASLPGI
jgi:hypothetical protein